MSSVESAERIESRVTGRLAGRLAGRVQAGQAHWAARVVSWIDLADLCRELDDALVLSEGPSEDALRLHESVLSLAIGCGSWLLHQIRENRPDLSTSGQSLEALDATVELLRILYRSRHVDFPASEVEAVRQRIFNAAA